MEGVLGSSVKVVESSPKREILRFYHVLMRIMGLLLTLTAAIMAGLDKETTDVSISLAQSLPAVHFPVTAKWQYMSAFVYFVVANAIACSYAAASLLVSMGMKSLKQNAAMALNILDIIVMGLLLSANGAAIAIGLIGSNGNSHVQWSKVCNMFEGFCRRLTAAMILSLVGSFVFLWLVVVAIVTLHRKSR